MKKRITSFLITLCMVFSVFGVMSANSVSAADTMTDYGEYIDGWYHISKASQLKKLAELSKEPESDVRSAKFVLDNDIVLSSATDDKLVNIAPDKDRPFTGIFDGNGHSIQNLSYSTHIQDSGLFAHTSGATIKNLQIINANIMAANRGGIVVGDANNTKFMNISVKGSYIKLISGGVLLSVITADGAVGGAVAGEAINNCLFYNCESTDTIVTVGECEAISALGGNAYYFGGLVGYMDNSHVEYSRSMSEKSIASGQADGSVTIIVAAAEGTSYYTGGLIGGINNGSTILDSFSNVHVKECPATGVTVAAAAYGYAGGIVGRAIGTATKIERCQYSGYAEQRGFGGLLVVLPITNKHIGGIIGCIDDITDSDSRFKYCYYNKDRIEAKSSPGIKGDHAAAWRVQSASIYNEVAPSKCGSFTNDEYANIETWKDTTLDFDGNVFRDTKCNELLGGPHVNQWVMKSYNYDADENTDPVDATIRQTTMPVHGAASIPIYSNFHDAFTEDAKSMEYTYSVNTDGTVKVPVQDELTQLDENKPDSAYVGIALVTRRLTVSLPGAGESSSVTERYTCDAVYSTEDKIPFDQLKAYANDTDKRIYAVWCQGKTVGGQISLDNQDYRGIRILTAVNTKLLENIGLITPDSDYFRGTTFTMDGNEYYIQADSGEWRGENYYTNQVNDVDDARVFSIFAKLSDDELNKDIVCQGEIMLENVEEKFIDFMCGGSVKRSAAGIAQAYLNDLQQSRSDEDFYGIGEGAYNSLMDYISD